MNKGDGRERVKNSRSRGKVREIGEREEACDQLIVQKIDISERVQQQEKNREGWQKMMRIQRGRRKWRRRETRKRDRRRRKKRTKLERK